MTLYIYNFDKSRATNAKIYFNNNVYVEGAAQYRLKIVSRYNNMKLAGGSADNSTEKYWIIQLSLVSYNDRYTTFLIAPEQEDIIARQFASGYYDYTLQYSNNVNINPTPNPNIEDSFIDIETGMLKLKTSATENLATEGTEKDYFPTVHYKGPNDSTQSYLIYNKD
jgi:hypothetical protein